MFDKEFVTHTQELLGEESRKLFEALDSQPVVSVRLNPFKTDAPPTEVAGIKVIGEVPWCRYGRYLAERPSFTTDPLFHGGRYYVQEASSMFVEHAYLSVAEEGARVLDMCAAPGGKTTLYSTLTGPEGLVVANEVIRARASILADNARKWGVGNIIVTNNDPTHFSVLKEWFDVVAVDAPCSGEGMFRKDPAAREQWSADNVRISAARQRRILADAWEALAPGGALIYSTCTFNKYENEDNIEWLAENFDCEDAGIEVPADWNIVQTDAAGIRCFRFFPHKVNGEGFFCAVLRKSGQKGRPIHPKARRTLFTDVSKRDVQTLSKWVGQPEYMVFSQVADNVYGYYASVFKDVRAVSESLNAIHSGICMGQLFNGKLKPDHSLALFHDVSREIVPVAELDLEEALRFMRKDDIRTIDALVEGINLIAYKGAPIGWAKRIGHRANNLYPKSLMIIKK